MMTIKSYENISGRESSNRVEPQFEKKFQVVKSLFFSRDKKYWSCFADPCFKSIVDFRMLNLNPTERISAYPQGEELHDRIRRMADIPKTFTSPEDRIDDILKFAAALSKDWENPGSVENVITMSCDPGIYGTMIGSLCNANLVYREYSQMADELEKCIVRQIANLAGYDAKEATGIFTQGGTFCNLYGYLLGIRKSLPESRQRGIGAVHDYRMINSLGGHYSNITNLALLGIDVESKTIRIKITETNDIDLKDLEHHLSVCFQLNRVVPTIMLTMGTTDTFGVDRVKPVYDLRNRLCEKYEIKVKPHIHVDSAIGWTMLFFLNYDFSSNPLHINKKTVQGLRKNSKRFKELKYADSFTVDFQKWGYVPYTSSLVMFKNKGDLKHLENDPENFSYFERELQGYTHLQSTIECSRGATGVFGAYAALNHMGIKGYQTILAHCLQNANYFRYRLSQLGFVKVMAVENQGPSVGFRIYNPEVTTNGECEYQYEYNIQDSAEYLDRLQRNNSWHRQVYINRGKIGLFTNWVEFIAHTDYDKKGKIHKLPGEKAVFMNPATTRKEINLFISNICRGSL